MIRTGVCSITFRKLAPEEVVALVSKAGLDAIEWGGDIHVPPEPERGRTERVREITESAGLAISSYGSYFNVLPDMRKEEASSTPGRSLPEEKRADFKRVLDAAQALGCPVVRVWTGGKGSAEAAGELFEACAARTREMADMAAERRMRVAFEFHRGGLTDTVHSTLKLCGMVGRENAGTYYQVYEGEGVVPERDVERLLPYLVNVHCDESVGAPPRPRLLEHARDRWLAITRVLKAASFDGHILLEFALEGKQENFLRDTAALKEIVSAAGD